MKPDVAFTFTPRPYQLEFFDAMRSGCKRAVCVWHRRSGKDFTALSLTVDRMRVRKGIYWHVFPTEEQGRKAIWEGFTKDGLRIMEQVFPREYRKSPESFTPNGTMTVELKNGSIWRLVGSDKSSLVGSGPVGVVFSEYSLARATAWDLIRPMLAENDGWAAFLYTPRGNNHGKKLYEMALKNREWFAERLTVDDTHALPQSIIDEERASGMPEPLVRQEYYCDFTAALVGSVWGDLLEQLEKAGGMEAFEHGTDSIFTSWDLGISDSTAIWFWRLRQGGVDFVDYYENRGQPLSHYFDTLDEWAKTKRYIYVKHLLPHDARARTLQTGQSILDQCLERWGPSLTDITPSLSLLDGIQAMRWLLQRNVRFHPRCSEGLDALRDYHYAYDEDKKRYGGLPEHNWSSHGADAARYAAVVYRQAEQAMRPPPKREPVKWRNTKKGLGTLDELLALQDEP